MTYYRAKDDDMFKVEGKNNYWVLMSNGKIWFHSFPDGVNDDQIYRFFTENWFRMPQGNNSFVDDCRKHNVHPVRAYNINDEDVQELEDLQRNYKFNRINLLGLTCAGKLVNEDVVKPDWSPNNPNLPRSA